MAEKRMFSKKIVDTDAFLNMNSESRLLYYEICMRCDDDGFCTGPSRVLRMTGASEAALQTLIHQGFLLAFDGLVVVKHWRLHNNLKNDRIAPPNYPEVAQVLQLKANGVYTTDQTQGVMDLLTYKRIYGETKQNPLRDFDGIHPESQKRGEEKRGEEQKGAEQKREEKSAAESRAAEEPDSGADSGQSDGCGESEELQLMGGTLGQGVLLISDKQISDLLAQMPLADFDRYTKRLSDYVIRNGAGVRSHYRTILKWWKEDRQVQPRAGP